MRCNRLKPIWGRFQILCGILIVGVALGINAISSVEAATQIGAGDRIFFLGDQWATNRTASQNRHVLEYWDIAIYHRCT